MEILVNLSERYAIISYHRSGGHNKLDPLSVLQVNDVEAAIKGLMDGTIKPEDVKVEGIETEEEKMEKEVRTYFYLPATATNCCGHSLASKARTPARLRGKGGEVERST
jgi:hypothetical protein